MQLSRFPFLNSALGEKDGLPKLMTDPGSNYYLDAQNTMTNHTRYMRTISLNCIWLITFLCIFHR